MRRCLPSKGAKWRWTFNPPGESEAVIARVSASLIHERKGKYWVQAIFHDISLATRINENLDAERPGTATAQQDERFFPRAGFP